MKRMNELEFCDQLSDKEQRNYTGIIDFNEGSTIYYKNGYVHREDGPAWYFTRTEFKEYWIYGIKTTKEGMELYSSLLKLKGLL